MTTNTMENPRIQLAMLGQMEMKEEYTEEYRKKRQALFTSMVKFMDGYDDLEEISDVLLQEFMNIQNILTPTDVKFSKHDETLIFEISFPTFVSEKDFTQCAILYTGRNDKIFVPAIIPAKSFFGVESQFKTEWVLKGKKIPATKYTLTI